MQKFSKALQLALLALIFLSTLHFAGILNKFSSTANLCFSGKDRSGYDLPIYVHNFLNTSSPLKNNAILIDDINPDHVNRADVELIFNIEAYKKSKQILTNPKNEKKLGEFNELFFVGNDCTPRESMIKFQSIIKGKYLLYEKQKLYGNNYCFVRYDILKSDQSVN